MKNSWQILTTLLAVALVILSIKINVLSDSSLSQTDKQQSAMDVIMSRSSVRSYTSKKVETEKIDKLLKAAMAAPTAGNKQPWDFIVVNDRATLDEFANIIPGAHMAKKAQTAIVVCGSPTKSLLPDYWIQDCSAASENILLAAHALGLGAVWCGAYPNNEQNRVEKMSKLLSLPDDVYALSVIVVGYGQGEPAVKDKWDPSKVHYNKF
ncbi:MAG: nitroreductase family protein [Rikenellaceae bacterium]